MSKDECTSKTTGDETNLTKLQNKTGIFLCDEKGMLIRFEPSAENLIGKDEIGKDKKCRTHLHSLILPEGIRSIGSLYITDIERECERLRYLWIDGELLLPDSLTRIGFCGFTDSIFDSLVLPASLREISNCAFSYCHIRKLRIAKGLNEPIYYLPPETEIWEKAKAEGLAYAGRVFKETVIDTMIVPKDYPYEIMLPQAEANNVVFY